MAAKIINLKARKKALARNAKVRQADENAAKHGRTKAQRNADVEARVRAEFLLDAHRRDDPET